MHTSNLAKVHRILEQSADRVFDTCVKDGDYFLSLNFEVKVQSDKGGFETVITHRTKKGFFEESEEKL